MSLIVSPLHAGEVEAYFANREGLKQLSRENNVQAHREFMRALEQAPLSAAVQLNLGYSFILNEEWDKAEQTFRGALSLLGDEQSRDARFQALFNIGVAASHQKKLDAALSAYQAALEIDPENKDVKTNIELLWQGQGGGGDGESKDKDQENKDKDQRGRPKDDPSQDEKQKNQEKKKQQPKPFESQELRQEDVKRILDEIKNQEQNIRANEYERKGKDVPKGKDW